MGERSRHATGGGADASYTVETDGVEWTKHLSTRRLRETLKYQRRD
jgi:hypothetical protein